MQGEREYPQQVAADLRVSWNENASDTDVLGMALGLEQGPTGVLLAIGSGQGLQLWGVGTVDAVMRELSKDENADAPAASVEYVAHVERGLPFMDIAQQSSEPAFCLSNITNAELFQSNALVTACALPLRADPTSEKINVVCGSRSGAVALISFDPLTGKRDLRQLSAAHSQMIRGMCFDETGEWFVTGSWDRTASVFNLTTGQVECSLSHAQDVNGVRFLPGDQIVTTSDDCKIRLWDIRTNACVEEFGSHNVMVRDVSTSVNGDFFASGDSDGYVCVWDRRTFAAPIFTHKLLHPVYGMSMTPDGRYFAAATAVDAYMVSVDSASPSEPRIESKLAGHGKSVRRIAIPPQGRYCATSENSGACRLWSLAGSGGATKSARKF